MIENPPLNALAAFEAAARLGSFTRAGEELCVTQAAISQHIRHLEEYLGVPLFIRRTPGIRLTPDGERYYVAVSGALETLRRESARLRRGSGGLSVVAEASFANRWLAPRLSRFCERHPEVDIRIAPHPFHPELGPEVDIIVRRDMPQTGGVFRLELPEERLFPVFGPEYAGKDGRNWREERLLLFQFTYMALAAAAEGRGAALSGSLLAVEDLRAGRLHALRSPSIAVTSRYTAACPGEAADTPRVRAFFNWMREELERDMTEFPDCFPEADGS